MYWREVITAFDKSDNHVTFLEPKGEPHNLFYTPVRGNLRHSILKEKWNAKFLSFLSSNFELKPTFIFHSSYYRTSRKRNAINVVTIHDFMPEMFFTGLRRFYHVWRKRRAIRNADGIICVSANTRNDLTRFYPRLPSKEVVTIPLGISPDYYPIKDSSKAPLPASTKPYLLFVGRRSHYKNFRLTIDILKMLGEFELVVAGEKFSAADHQLIAVVSDRVRLVENPSNEVMNKLYNDAFCLLYPSSYEGFRIPVLEAMAAGCPVVALNASSIPEISAGAAVLVNELRAAEFATAIRRLLVPAFRSEVVQLGLANTKRFSWTATVAGHREFYQRMFGKFSVKKAQSGRM